MKNFIYFAFLSFAALVGCTKNQYGRKVFTRKITEAPVICFWNDKSNFLYSKNEMMKDSLFIVEISKQNVRNLIDYIKSDTSLYVRIPLNLDSLKESDDKTKRFWSAFEPVRFKYLSEGRVCVINLVSNSIEPYIYLNTPKNSSAQEVIDKNGNKIYSQILFLK